MRTGIFGPLAAGYPAMRAAAIDAARRNNAALWFAGAPSDLAGFVYQDSTGTTAATGTDPIGLMLDRSYGPGNLGPELVSGQTWATGSANTSISGGDTVVFAGANNGAVGQANIPVVVGKYYKLSITISGLSAGAVGVDPGGAASYPNMTANGVYTPIVLCAGGSGAIYSVAKQTTTTASVKVTSAKEVLGYPALQATAANKPALLINPAGYYDASFDAINDTWSVALPSGGTPAVVSYTDTGAISGYVSATTSGFVIGAPTIGGKKLSLLVASASALPAGDLAIIKAFAGAIRGSAF